MLVTLFNLKVHQDFNWNLFILKFSHISKNASIVKSNTFYFGPKLLEVFLRYLVCLITCPHVPVALAFNIASTGRSPTPFVSPISLLTTLLICGPFNSSHAWSPLTSPPRSLRTPICTRPSNIPTHPTHILMLPLVLLTLICIRLHHYQVKVIP